MANLASYNNDGPQAQTYTIANVLAANVPESITVPSDQNGLKARYVTFGRGAATTDVFFAQAFNTSDGPDRVTNGTFAADTDWVKGTGWTIAAGVATATGAISTALTQTVAGTSLLKQGQAYYVTFTATRSAGTVTVNVGGTAGTARSSAATFSEILIAGSSQDISFTTSGFTGTVDDVSVIPCASVPVDATLGLSPVQNPASLFLGNNNDASRISIVSAGTPTITTSFYK